MSLKRDFMIFKINILFNLFLNCAKTNLSCNQQKSLHLTIITILIHTKLGNKEINYSHSVKVSIKNFVK